jgi:DeoR family transcriptional regulator, fructose operon transcriptional repressor
MFPEERRANIVDVLSRYGSRSVSDLAKDLEVSEVTVRQDLDLLEKQKVLRRTHGGAILNSKVSFEPVFQFETNDFKEEKIKIGLAAIEFVSDGDTLILDSGTTILELARNLKYRKNLTVLTNSLNVAMILEDYQDINILVTGGTLSPKQHCLVNPFARFILEKIHADIAFLSVSGIVAEHGISSINIAEAEIKNCFIQCARRSIILADSSKIGNISLAKIADVDEINHLITDKNADPVEITLLKDKGLNIQLV